MTKISNINDDLLVSNIRHHSLHPYGIDLPSISMQDEKHPHGTTCHLCCLFALTCPHPSDSQQFKRLDRFGLNENAILSSMDIWKETTDFPLISSPLDDLPRCFHRNYFTKEETMSMTSNISLWNTHQDQHDTNEV